MPEPELWFGKRVRLGKTIATVVAARYEPSDKGVITTFVLLRDEDKGAILKIESPQRHLSLMGS